MKKITFLLTFLIVVFSCCRQETPQVEHVVFMGFDAMSAIGIQRAETPNFNKMIENGAVSLHTRCGRPTNSSPNWMTMASATPFEMHGVLDNGTTPLNGTVTPALINKKGFFPTIFEFIRAQRPDVKMYFYGESGWMGMMYDLSVFDRVVPDFSKRERLNADDAIHQAAQAFINDKPELMFVAIGTPDHEGHKWGHENKGYLDCVSHMDKLVGDFVNMLEDNDMIQNTVIVITADHGGTHYGHGGDTMAELEVPVIMYGGPVTKGKVMEHSNMSYDTPATVAGLLGVELPWECHGKFLKEAFEPKTDACYVPVPMVHPFRGIVGNGEKVTLTADIDGAEIYYTLDGSEPTLESTKYTGPFALTESCTIRAVTYKNGCYSIKSDNFLFASAPEGSSAVKYQLYRNYKDVVLPDFSRMGKPDVSGIISAFSLDDVPVSPDEDHFAVLFTSNLKIEKGGNYRFELTSDDGTKLYIDGKLIIDNDKSHTQLTKYGTAELSEGVHTIKVEYFEDTDGQYLFLNYAPEGQILRPIYPSELLL